MPENIVIGLTFAASVGTALEAIKQIGGAVEGMKGKTEAASRVHAQLGDAIKRGTAAGRDVSGLERHYARLGASIQKATAAQAGFVAAREKAAGHRAALGSMWGEVMATAGLGMTLAAPIKSAIDFESAMADVRKVVDGTDREIADLGQSIIGMSRKIPLGADGLAAIAASGGQLGVALKDIPQFTEMVAKMSVAFDTSAEETGDSMAKLANVYNLPISRIGRLGDVINQLSNESPAKAGDIVNALGRIGGVAKQFGLSEEKAAALANAMVSLGKPPEVAGTAINGMLTKLATADKQGKEFQKALAGIGMSASGLKAAIEEDANGALVTFLEALEKVDASKRTGLLVDLFGIQYADDVAVLAGSVGTLKNSLSALGRAEGSMEKEFAARAATTANSLQLLKNNVTELGISLGSTLLPAVNDAVNSIRPVVYSFIEWSKENPVLVANIGKTVAGALALNVGMIGLRTTFHSVMAPFWGFVSVGRAAKSTFSTFGMLYNSARSVTALGDASATATRAMGIWRQPMHIFPKIGSMLGAIVSRFGVLGRAVLWVGGLFLTGISMPAWATMAIVGSAVAAAAYAVYRYWKPLKEFFAGFWNGLKQGIEPIAPIFRESFSMMAPLFREIGAALKPVIDWFKGMAGPVKSSGAETQKFGEIVGYVIGAVVKWFAVDMPDAVIKGVAGLGKLPGDFMRLGQNIIGGLIEGIHSKMTEAKDAIVNVGSSVKGWFSGVLGISSPSRVFMKYGGFLDEGLAIGIGSSIGQVKSAVGALSKAAIPNIGQIATPKLPNIGGMAREALSNPISNLPKLPNTQKSVNSAIHYSPTINLPGGMPGAGDVAGQVRGVVEQNFEDFRKQMKRYQQEMGRVGFGRAF